MERINIFLKTNSNLQSYILFIISLLVFAAVSLIINHLIFIYSEKSHYGKRGMVRYFIPFLTLAFLISGETFSFLFFNLEPEIEKSLSFFINMQIIWGVFWLIISVIRFVISETTTLKSIHKKLYNIAKIILLLIILSITITSNYQRIVSALLALIITFVLLKLSSLINQTPFFWQETTGEEEKERKISCWDYFHITLPYNLPDKTIEKALSLAKQCVSQSDKTGKNFSVLLKDLGERGIVIEVKYLVLDSKMMKETRHELLSQTLKKFSQENIPMSPPSYK
jgi:small-conductance mechanosensitive channel